MQLTKKYACIGVFFGIFNPFIVKLSISTFLNGPLAGGQIRSVSLITDETYFNFYLNLR